MSRTKVTTINEIRNKVGILAKEYGAERIYLFGTYARGEERSNSDVDLRIDKGHIKGLFALGGLKADLEESLGLSVDLLPTDSLDDKFLKLIQGEEVLIYGREQ